MFSRKRSLLFSLAIVAMVALIAGCSDDDDNNSILNPNPNPGSGSEVRIVHASATAPSVDVWAAGLSAPLVSGLDYGDATDYLSLDPGTYTIQLRAHPSQATDPVAFEVDLTVPSGEKITAVAMGILGSSNTADEFRVVPYVENFTTPAGGNAVVRIVHASPDAPTVAVDVGDDATPEIASLARFADVDNVELPAGTALQVAIWTASPLSRVTAFTTPMLPDGGELFVIATGLLGNLPRETEGFSLLAVGPAGAIGFVKQNPVVFALHASPDAPPVDIAAGNAVLAANLDFGGLSEPIQVAPGSYTLDFRATGTTTAAATAPTGMLVAGERYLAIATGFLGDSSFELLAFADQFGLTGSMANVRILHTSPDAPAVDIGTVAGGVVTPVNDFVDLAFRDGSAASGTALPAGSLDIGVAATGTTTAVAEFGITTSSGLRAFAVAGGSFLGNGETFRLFIVDTTAFPWSASEVLPKQ